MKKDFWQCPECKRKIAMKQFHGGCPICGYLETKETIAFILHREKNEMDAAKSELENAYNLKHDAYQDYKAQIITYDEFQEYVDDYNKKKEIYDKIKKSYQDMKEYYQEVLNHLNNSRL